MDTLTTASTMVQKDSFMASIDLTDAYYSVSIALEDRKYLFFWFDGQSYKYDSLTDGLSSAPRIFIDIEARVLRFE